MRIAIPTDSDLVSVHFGRCPLYTIVDIENNEIVQKNIVNNPGHQPEFIPNFLHQQGVECVVTGGMGRKAISLFEEFGIKLFFGITGKVEDIIKELKNGTLISKESLCKPGLGSGYGVEKESCDHANKNDFNYK